MLDLYYWATPNGHKITMLMEEAALTYRIIPVDISAGEQFSPDFLAIAPNNKIPAIVDHAPSSGDDPVRLFESGAILLYLADKIGRFIPPSMDVRARVEVLQWLFWQMGGLGPIAGQNHHFSHSAPEKIPYAIDRFVKETTRLYSVLDRRLANRPFVAGADYSIADMAIYPWVVSWKRQGQEIDTFVNLRRWLDAIQERPATTRAYSMAEHVKAQMSVGGSVREVASVQAKAQGHR